MREKQSVIREYRRQKERALKASLIPTKRDPVLASDANCNNNMENCDNEAFLNLEDEL